MKDLFKLIIALPFLGFQAGFTSTLGCIGSIFAIIGVYSLGWVFIEITKYLILAFGGHIESIKIVIFLFFVILGSWKIGEIISKIQKHIITED